MENPGKDRRWKFFQKYRNSRPELFLGKGRSENMQQNLQENTHAEVWFEITL